MSATVTNQQLGVTTTTSGHEAKTDGATDVNYDPPKKKTAPHPNEAPTKNAVDHTTGKTKFQEGQVVRVGDKIDPSKPPHGDSGGGVASGTYIKEAKAVKGSQDVRTEGKAPARHTDPTTQNHANTTGKMQTPGNQTTISALTDEMKKTCSYAESTIDCGHWPPTKEAEISVLRGDKITVKAKRKNAKTPGAAIACHDPPHMKWKVHRSGGTTAAGAALPEKTGEFTGDTLVLSGEWTASSGQVAMEGEHGFMESKSAKQYAIDQKNKFAQSNAVIRTGQAGATVTNADGQKAYQQLGNRLEDAKNQGKGAINVQQAVNLAVNLEQFWVAWKAWQNPVKLAIEGEACSGSVSYEISCFPAGKYPVELPLDGLQKAGKWMNKAMTTVKTLGKLGNCDVEASIQCPGPGAKVGCELEWKEEKPGYEIVREVEFSMGGELMKGELEFKFPLANLLALIPAIGAVAAKGVAWAIKKLGVDASVGVHFEVGVSLAIAMTFTWTKKEGWHFDSWAPAKIPIDLKIYIFLRIHINEDCHCEGRLVLEADPAFVLEKSKEGLTLASDDCSIRAGVTLFIHVDVGLFSFDENGTYYPDSLQCRIHKFELWQVIKN